MRQYCPARAEEDKQGNLHVNESEDLMEEEEEDLDNFVIIIAWLQFYSFGDASSEIRWQH